MPVYDYICKDCQKSFELVLTLSEHDKDNICSLWFDHGLNDANGATEMLAPFDALRMSYPVSTRVNLVKNDEPDCAAPIQAAE